MKQRMNNPAVTLAGAMQGLLGISKAIEHGGLPATIRNMVNLRASQINGCSVCVFSHAGDMKKAGESDERIYAVGAWRDAPFFNDAERAALALTEAVTRLSDRADPVPDEVWNDVKAQFDEPTLSALVLSIGLINVWNRLNVATRQVAGAAW
jgi:AhpD family alkylhydroperoxidase